MAPLVEAAAPPRGARTRATVAWKRCIVEGLEQVVDRAHLEGLQRVVIVGGDEHDHPAGLPGPARAPVPCRSSDPSGCPGTAAAAAGPDRLEGGARRRRIPRPRCRSGSRCAALAQRAACRRLVIDDHDVHQLRRSALVRAGRAGPSRSSGMWISASHRSSSTGAALKLARSPKCTSQPLAHVAQPDADAAAALAGRDGVAHAQRQRSRVAYASTRMFTGPSWPARPCTTAFSTSGCRIRLGTQARARSSHRGTRHVRRSAKRCCCSSRYSATNCSSSARRDELALTGGQQPAQQVAELHHHGLRGRRVPADLAADRVQQVEQRVRRELHAQRRQACRVQARSSAAARSCESRSRW